MPKRESIYVKETRNRLKKVKPVEFALDEPLKVKQFTIHSINGKICVKFRFIEFSKDTGVVKFSITQKTSTHASKETNIRRIQVFDRHAYFLDKYITVRAMVDQENNLFKLEFIPNPNA